MDKIDPQGVYHGSNQFRVSLTPFQAIAIESQQGEVPLVAYGGINLVTADSSTDYLSAIAKHQPALSLSKTIFQNIDVKLKAKLKKKIKAILNDIEDEMAKIKEEIPKFLALQNSLLRSPFTQFKDDSLAQKMAVEVTQKSMAQKVNSHQGTLLKSYGIINKKISRLRKIAVKNKVPSLEMALDGAMADSDIIDDTFGNTVTQKATALHKEVESFWEEAIQQLTGTESVVTIKDIKVSITSASTPPPPPPTTTLSRVEAIKLLRQGSYTSFESQIQKVMKSGAVAWVDSQLEMSGKKRGYLKAAIEIAISKHSDKRMDESMLSNFEKIPEGTNDGYPDYLFDRRDFHNTILLERIFNGNDQLRQRMANALSQILVASSDAPLGDALARRGEALSHYYDILYDNAFGNYGDLLKEVTMSPAMAYYLTFIGSKKEGGKDGDESSVAPDENYARELMQLFSIGVYELDLDDSPAPGEDDNQKPSYEQKDISELARVFTGWDWMSRAQDGDDFYKWSSKYGNQRPRVHSMIDPIEFTPDYHDYGEKTVLGETIEAGLDGEDEIDRVIEILMANPNIAPHVSRNLITRFVTSNPTDEYVKRVATVFDDNGYGVKGDLKATLRAILLDPEARGKSIVADFGKADEFFVAFTHFLSRFDVKPLFEEPGVDLEKRKRFGWTTLNQHFKQLPLTSDSVFNFYSQEYMPADTYFINNNLVAPEMEIRTGVGLQHFIASFQDFVLEKYVLEKSFGSMEKYYKKHQPAGGFLINAEEEYEYFEEQVGGALMKDDTLRNEAIGKLIDHLAIKMVGEPISEAYRQALLSYLSTNVRPRPERIIPAAMEGIATSSLFMVLK